jgi:hypothetical protein
MQGKQPFDEKEDEKGLRLFTLHMAQSSYLYTLGEAISSPGFSNLQINPGVVYLNKV